MSEPQPESSELQGTPAREDPQSPEQLLLSSELLLVSELHPESSELELLLSLEQPSFEVLLLLSPEQLSSELLLLSDVHTKVSCERSDS